MVMVFAMVGCGVEEEEEKEEPIVVSSTVIEMEVGKTYTIKKGQTVVRKREPTEIFIQTDIETGVTTVRLLNGMANIE